MGIALRLLGVLLVVGGLCLVSVPIGLVVAGVAMLWAGNEVGS